MCTPCLLIVFVEAFINVLAGALTLALFVRTILTWLPDTRLPLVGDLVWDVTEPLVAPWRRLTPLLGGVDFSPLIALLAIQVVTFVLLRLLPPAV
ncbi:MAG TPA: YggT family protein [Candidatus Limnocylindria bacterium]|jgi:YggT family protein|nr:YggT family protein [Candidatus Limnocylindria bacterium]